MSLFLNISSLLALVLAVCIAVCNWIWVILDYRNMSRGIQRHVSTMPGIVQFLAVFAGILLARVEVPLFPAWWVVVIALEDALFLLLTTFILAPIRRRFLTSI